MEKKTKQRGNAPVRARRAWVRFTAALLTALALLAATEFGLVKLARGAAPLAQRKAVAAGDYVQHDVRLILDNFALGYAGDTAEEVYAVVPTEQGLCVFCFPERWFAAELDVRAQTDRWRADRDTPQERHLAVSGTAQTMSPELWERTRDWFSRNAAALAREGLIPADAEPEDVVSDCVIMVDQVGSMSCGTVMLLSLAAFVLLGYALAVLLRIRLRGYPEKKK